MFFFKVDFQYLPHRITTHDEKRNITEKHGQFPKQPTIRKQAVRFPSFLMALISY